MRTFNEYLLIKEGKVNTEGLSKQQIQLGMEVEREHDGRMGKDTKVASSESDILKIVVAHLREDPKYYTKLKKIEG
jgi:hypothetical protein